MSVVCVLNKSNCTLLLVLSVHCELNRSRMPYISIGSHNIIRNINIIVIYCVIFSLYIYIKSCGDISCYLLELKRPQLQLPTTIDENINKYFRDKPFADYLSLRKDSLNTRSVEGHKQYLLSLFSYEQHYNVQVVSQQLQLITPPSSTLVKRR